MPSFKRLPCSWRSENVAPGTQAPGNNPEQSTVLRILTKRECLLGYKVRSLRIAQIVMLLQLAADVGQNAQPSNLCHSNNLAVPRLERYPELH